MKNSGVKSYSRQRRTEAIIIAELLRHSKGGYNINLYHYFQLTDTSATQDGLSMCSDSLLLLSLFLKCVVVF